jgi:deoxyribodipyrimidine photo-lyase
MPFVPRSKPDGNWSTAGSSKRKAVEELARLVEETHANAIFFNRDLDPFGRRTEDELEAFGEKAGIKIVGCKDATIHERDEVLTSAGEPFRVFTPYARAWAKVEKAKARGRIGVLRTPNRLSSLPLPTLETWGLKPEAEVLAPGEKAARARMKWFLD